MSHDRLPSASKLILLTRRAIVALACRAIRRAQPLCQADKLGSVFENSLTLCEQYSVGGEPPGYVKLWCDEIAADNIDYCYQSLANLIRAVNEPEHDNAARAAARALRFAVHASVDETSDAFQDEAIATTRNQISKDYEQLRQVASTNVDGHIGSAIDYGRLGPLWSDGEPDWGLRQGSLIIPPADSLSGAAIGFALRGLADDLVDAPRMLAIVTEDDVDQDSFAEFLAELAKLYAELSGGDELIIREGKVPIRTAVPA